MKRFLFILVIACLLMGCTSSAGNKITHVYAFGDGFSDNGNFYNDIKEIPERGTTKTWFDTYNWEGRASNGPVAVEILADRLGVELTDYAVVGAKLYNTIWVDNNEGLVGQVDKFIADLQGNKADPDALYCIFFPSELISLMSNSEFRGGGGPANPESSAESWLDEMAIQITRLAENGAKKFLVVNCIDMSIQPVVIANQDTVWSVPFQKAFNAGLPDKMDVLAKELGIKIQIFDHPAFSDQICSDPGKYGLTNLDEQCLVQTSDSQGAPSGIVCDSPDSYYFWDETLPTRRLHELLGEAIYDLVK